MSFAALQSLSQAVTRWVPPDSPVAWIAQYHTLKRNIAAREGLPIGQCDLIPVSLPQRTTVGFLFYDKAVRCKAKLILATPVDEEELLFESPFDEPPSVVSVQYYLEGQSVTAGDYFRDSRKIGGDLCFYSKNPPLADSEDLLYQLVDTITFAEGRQNTYVQTALQRSEIRFLGELVKLSPDRVRTLRQLGPGGFKAIEETVTRLGLHLGMKLPQWRRPGPRDKRLLNTPVADIRFVHRSCENKIKHELMHANGIFYLGQLVQMNKAEVTLIHSRLPVIEKYLAEIGLGFDMDVGDWKPPTSN